MTILAAILCPGPSLAKTWPQKDPDCQFDIVIAVNRAILHEPNAGWWAVGDWPLIRDTPGKPRYGICTQKDAVRIIREGGIISAERRVGWSPQLVSWDMLTIGCRYSIMAGLGLAAYLGAGMAFIYGDDKSGATDWDGVEAGQNRGADRWNDERALMNGAVNKLKAKDGLVTHWIRG